MRKGMRGLVARFGAIGIPASRVALELQFQSAPGQGGRQGLQPTSAWLEFVKLEALAAKQVAADTRIEGVWSWGWPSFSVAGNDPDKPAAACVYLWTRDPKLCDAPAVAGAAFNAVTHARARSSCRRVSAARSATRTDREGRRRTGRGADRRPRRRLRRRCCERVVLRADEPVDPADGARGRTRDRARPVRRQRHALPRGARGALT